MGPLQRWRLAIYGVLLVLMVFAPHGLMGLPLWRRWQRLRPAPPLPPAPADLRALPALPALHTRVAAPQALQLQGLDKHFGGVKALQGCTLSAAAGQTHALVGPNEVALALPRARRDHAQSSAEAMALLRFVGLAERAHALAGDLPHGQQRLVEIARALAGRPALLLLDEPAAGLSMDELNRLGALIEAITARGTTVLIVEHHLELIARISQQVTVLDRGQVLAAGTPDEVFRHPEVEPAYMGREGSAGAR